MVVVVKVELSRVRFFQRLLLPLSHRDEEKIPAAAAAAVRADGGKEVTTTDAAEPEVPLTPCSPRVPGLQRRHAACVCARACVQSRCPQQQRVRGGATLRNCAALRPPH